MNKWSCRKTVGMLAYLQRTTRPDIAMAVHQYARFSVNSKLSHERSIKRTGRYLLATKQIGIYFTPETDKGLEYFVDADFVGGWSKDNEI